MSDSILPPPATARKPRAALADDVLGPGDGAPALARARRLNLLGLFTPIANLGMTRTAPRELRWFGVGAGIALLGAGAWCADSGRTWPSAIAFASHAALVGVGLVHPRFPEIPAQAWAAVVRAIGGVVAVPLFAVLYFVLVPPAILVTRILFGSPARRRAPASGTYWVERPPVKRDPFVRRI